MVNDDASANLGFDHRPDHLRLFEREAVKLMRWDDIQNLLKFTNHEQHKVLDEMFSRGEECREEANRLLFRCVSYADDDNAVGALLELLRRDRSEDVQKQLTMSGLKTKKLYSKLYVPEPLKLDRIAGTLEPAPIVEFLNNRNRRAYDNLNTQVKQLLSMKRVEDAACLLIRGLPHCTDAKNSDYKTGEWYYDFLDACLSHGDTRMLPRFIDHEFRDDLDEFRAAKEVKLQSSKTFSMLDTNSRLVDPDFYPEHPRVLPNVKDYRVTSIELERSEYVLYAYQNELVAHARNGRNTIICAPTGSGKTIVAVDIVLNHVEEMRQDGKTPRAVMLVPTVPLVAQQASQFVKLTHGKCWTDGFSGADTLVDRANCVLSTDFCVMTPQILINMINSVVESDKLYFTDFTLMIFDECHHANEGNHPYNVLLQMLQENKRNWRPQIVGLTASVGVGKTSYQFQQARKHILELCSVMMCDSISTVRRYMDDLKAKVMPPIDSIERARRPTNDRFCRTIKGTMEQIHMMMQPFLENILKNQPDILKREDFDFLLNFKMIEQGAQYQAKVGILRRLVQKVSDVSVKLMLSRSTDHLSHYFYSLGVADLLPNKYALKYLDEKMALYIHRDHHPSGGIDKKMLDVYSELRAQLVPMAQHETVADKEILKKLLAIIKDQYTRKPDSRTLIFVSTRICAQRLSDYLNECLTDSEEMECFYRRKEITGYMTSSNQSATAGGQSSDLQRQMIVRFKSGAVSILVVTSVAEEGLDIEACNLIIKYNNVGSDRTLIQRRGRARAKDSRAILIALDTGVEQQEYENIRKEQMMMECIKDLQSQTDEVLKKLINQKTEELKQAKERKRMQEAELKDRLQTRKYNLKCRVCNTLISESMDIHSVANSFYVCCDPTVWNKSRNEIHKRPTKTGLTINCARWLCNQCNSEWGNVVKYSTAMLPSLKANAFILERYDMKDDPAQPLMVETWKRIETEFFNIYPITSDKIRIMLCAFRSHVTTEDYDNLLSQELLANKLEIEKSNKDRRYKEQILLEE